MKTRKIAYCLYFISCIASVLAIIFDNELLLLLFKPIMIPSIFYYYLTKTKNANVLFSVVMLLSFIGDTIMLLKMNNLIAIILPYYLSYLILVYFVMSDMIRNKLHRSSLIFSALVLVGESLLLYLILDLESVNGKQLIFPFTIYGITLVFLVSFAVYNYLAFRYISGFYMLIACACSLVSDAFYVLYHQHFQIPVLNYVNTAMQFLTYIFLVRYILNRKHLAAQNN